MYPPPSEPSYMD